MDEVKSTEYGTAANAYPRMRKLSLRSVPITAAVGGSGAWEGERESMLIAVHVGESGSAEWRDRLQEALLEFPCRGVDASLPSEQVTHAAVWQLPAGWLAALRRLRCVVSLEAGVNHFLDDPAFPQGVPVLRLGGEPLAVRMREYVLLAVLSLHRDLPGILENRRDWVRSDPVPPTAAERDVGSWGWVCLAVMQPTCCRRLDSGYPGSHDGAGGLQASRGFAGEAELGEFLRGAQILVNLLPLTALTRSMFDRSLFAQLPKGAGFVTVGRDLRSSRRICWTRSNRGSWPEPCWIACCASPCRSRIHSGGTQGS